MMPAGEHWLGLSTFGPITRTVGDSALMLDAMQGTTAGDTYTLPPFGGRYADAAARPPGRLRIAASKKIPPGLIASLSDDARTAFDRMATLLTELGHDLIERDPAYGMAGLVFTQTWVRGIYEDTLKVPDRSQLEPTTRKMAAAGRLVSERRAQKLRGPTRARITARMLTLWEEVDVVMTPALASTAIAAEGGYGGGALRAFDRSARFTPWTAAFNVTGQPAVAIPAGFGSDGLPVSVQLVGRLGGEDTLFSLAGEIEAARPWADRRPPLAAAAPAPS